jgi:hypothetical protein
MSFKSFVTTSVAAGATFAALAVAPAAQAGTFFFDGGLGESTEGFVIFTQKTLVDFTFIESRGMFASDFGVYDEFGTLLTTLFSENNPGYDPGSNDATNDWLGTCPTTVPNCNASFVFKEGVKYQFGLTAPKGGTILTGVNGDSGTVSDASLVAPDFSIISDADSYDRSTVGPTAIKGGADPQVMTIDTSMYDWFVAINDSHPTDFDVQDFIVGANAEAVPEPGTLIGIGVVAGLGFLGSRRKQKAEA